MTDTTTEAVEQRATYLDMHGTESAIADANLLRALAQERDRLQRMHETAFDAAVKAQAERDAARAQVARLREALRQIEADCEADYPPSHGAIKHAARAALAAKEEPK